MKQDIMKKEQILLFAIFFIFLFLRAFSDSPYFLIQGSDHARYLELAKNFPYHTLDNNQLFVYHRPLYPYTVHFLTWFFEDHLAGIMVSLISGIISFFIIYKLVLQLTKEKYIALGVLILFSLSWMYVYASATVMVESFYVMLALASIYFYVLLLKNNKIGYLWSSALFGALAAMTTDLAVLLILGLAATYAVFGNISKIWKEAIPILVTIVSYSAWIFLRMYIFSTFEYYPASIDGTIVRVSDWSLVSLFITDYFKEITFYMPSALPLSTNLNPLNYIYPIIFMLNLEIAPFPSGLRFSNINILFSVDNFPQLFIYSLLFIGASYGIYRIIKQIYHKKVKSNGILLVLILLLVFLLHLLQGIASLRYQTIAIVFLFIIINYGLFQLAKKFNFLKIYKASIIGLILILILYLPFYYAENKHFILSKQKIVEATKTAEFINQLPGNGIMAQIGYTQELDYLTNKRVMALPIHPDYMFLLDMYDINYLIYGEFYKEQFSENNKEKVFNYDTIKYIIDHPQQFKLLTVIEESYPTKERKDHIYIYEVI